MFQFPSEPQGIGGVLDSGFKLFAASFKAVLGLALLYALISAISGTVAATTAVQTGPDGLPTIQFGTAYVVTVLVALLVTIVLYPAIIKRTDEVARGSDEGGSAGALRYGASRSGWFLLCMLLYTIVFAVGVVLLVVPGLIFGLSLAFGPYAIVVLERKGPVQSLMESHKLVWGHWWRTLLMMTVVMIIVIVVYSILGLVLGIVAAVGGLAAVESATVLIDAIVAPLASVVLVPFMVSMGLAIYYDLKLRRGGADLAARLSEVEAT